MSSFCKENGTAQAFTNAGDIPAAGAIREARASHAALAELREQLVCAYRGGYPILLQGGGTCAFYGNPYRFRGEEIAGGTPAGFVPEGSTDIAQPAPVMLDCRRYAGVVSYDPSELVVTARCGTPLAELEALLAEQGQCLPFDPPHFAPGVPWAAWWPPACPGRDACRRAPCAISCWGPCCWQPMAVSCVLVAK